MDKKPFVKSLVKAVEKLQGSHVGMSRYQQDLPLPGRFDVAWSSLCCSLIVLLYCCLVQPTPLFADGPLITQEIHYRMPEASEVFLVWGIDGWQPVSKELRPAGTTILNSVLQTPMVRQNDAFIAKVQVPLGATIDFGFLITRRLDGTAIGVWDVYGDQQKAYRVHAIQDDVVEIQASSAIIRKSKFGDLETELEQVLLVSLVSGSVIFVIFIIQTWLFPPHIRSKVRDRQHIC
jgi:hypothetical protein